jgi:DNA (cytosine-5)-methyltransferase 1
MIAFAINQRDETRDLNGVAGALQAEPGMKQQTFVAQEPGCLTPWDTQQRRIHMPEGVAPTMTGANRQGGRNPAGLVFAAGFCAGAAPTAGGIGYQEETAPTLKAGGSGTNQVPSVLCINDQGGQRMDVSENITGALRAQMDGHPPLVFENRGIDSRYTGPHDVAPTISARYGTGGNNVPLAVGEAMREAAGEAVMEAMGEPDVYCVLGNTIDRRPSAGGNSCGCKPDVSYALTRTDRHAVFSRQRLDVFKQGAAVSAQSARQHKDGADLVMNTAADSPSSSGVAEEEEPAALQARGDVRGDARAMLIRRLTVLECERLQGYPDGWTDIPGASDSARYRALGNSVAIPCVTFVMRGIAFFLRKYQVPGVS